MTPGSLSDESSSTIETVLERRFFMANFFNRRGRLIKFLASQSERAMALTIFIITFVLFSVSTVQQLADSNYSMLLSESLLHHGSFSLDHYRIDGTIPIPKLDFAPAGSIYQLEKVNDHLYYYFPPGSSILSVPYVAVMNAAGISASNPDGSPNPYGEIRIQTDLAALLMAVLAVLFFYTSRLLLSSGWSLLVALGGALGTQVWSTATRALWSDTWGIFLLGFVVLILVAEVSGRRNIQPVVLASLLSWMYFVRPTCAVSIVTVTIYLFIFYRPLFLTYAVTGACWLAAFIAYSWSHFDQLLPDYYQINRLPFITFWEAIAGNLISPSRGLLIFVPVLIFVIYLLIRYWRAVAFPRLAVLSFASIIGHLIVVSGFYPWWGGFSFGPRYTTGLVPWFVLLGILGLQAWLTARQQPAHHATRLRWRVEQALGMILLAISILIHARGAMSQATWLWNSQPVSVDARPERLWDWRHPQFLATRTDQH